MYFLFELRRALLLSLVVLFLCGVAYPLALTGVSQVLAPAKANGSLVAVNGRPVGSALVGQPFTAPYFLKSRPSAVQYTSLTPADIASGRVVGLASGSANLAPSNPALAARVAGDMQTFLAAHPGVLPQSIPADLLTASASGLDPHISPLSAAVQLPALSQQSALSLETLEAIVLQHTTPKLWGLFGEATVHVLGVNMDILQRMQH